MVLFYYNNSDRSKQDKAAFEAQDIRSQTGIGAEGAIGINHL